MRNIRAIVGTLTITFSLLLATGQSVTAQALKQWKYTPDPSYDSLSGTSSSIFEIFGMATMEDENSLWFAFNSNLGLEGLNTGPNYLGYPVKNSNISFGDLFLDFSGTGNFATANAQQQLFGIRFAPNNDSLAPSIGIWSNFTAVPVVTQNAGYWNLGSYNSQVNAQTGLDSKIGELPWNDPYFSPYTSSGYIPNVIGTPSTKLGDITMVSSSDLAAAEFSLSNFPATGSQTFGFKFDKSLLFQGDNSALPARNYIATLIEECNNDSIASRGSVSAPVSPVPPPEEVPEPLSILGSLAAIGYVLRYQLRKPNSSNAVK